MNADDVHKLTWVKYGTKTKYSNYADALRLFFRDRPRSADVSNKRINTIVETMKFVGKEKY